MNNRKKFFQKKRAIVFYFRINVYFYSKFYKNSFKMVVHPVFKRVLCEINYLEL